MVEVIGIKFIGLLFNVVSKLGDKVIVRVIVKVVGVLVVEGFDGVVENKEIGLKIVK